MTTKVFITYAHKDGPASNRFRQYIDDPLPPWAVDVREEAATPTPRTDAVPDWNARCESQPDDKIVTHGDLLAFAHDEGDELRALCIQLECDLAAARAELAQERERAERAEARVKALLCHLPENWGDEVIEGEIMLRVDADAIAEGKK